MSRRVERLFFVAALFIVIGIAMNLQSRHRADQRKIAHQSGELSIYHQLLQQGTL